MRAARGEQFARDVLFFRATDRYPEAGINRGGFAIVVGKSK